MWGEEDGMAIKSRALKKKSTVVLNHCTSAAVEARNVSSGV